MPTRISRGRSLPLDLFVDEAVFGLEARQIWDRDWVFATPLDAVAEPGDFVAVTIGAQPIIVVRGQDLELRALANVCRHRGMPLVDGSGQAKRFPCPYHAWTYGNDGALQSVPYTMPDEISVADHHLAEYRCEVWHGLVFVNLDPDAEPLADRLSIVDPYVRPLAIDRLHHDVASTGIEEWQANWKVIHANAIDAYSQFRVHAETIEPISPTDGSYYLAGSAMATVTGGESLERADHLVIAIPPSFVAVIYPDAMLWQSITPLAVDRSLVRVGLAAERIDDGVAVNLPGWDARFLDEDRAICERLQRNARARSEPGALTAMERALGDFHEYLAWRLTEVLPSEPFVAARPGERPEPD
ncbi:MAG: aromatic ring-hydroxylating dioxygenase subunit alpha [Actinomycetota bacterium]